MSLNQEKIYFLTPKQYNLKTLRSVLFRLELILFSEGLIFYALVSTLGASFPQQVIFELNALKFKI